MDEEALRRVAAEVAVCRRCDLGLLGQRGVAGVGPAPAEVMVIGEAPSALDDRRGRPFSGPSGDVLDELLGLADLRRDQVYLTETEPAASRGASALALLANVCHYSTWMWWQVAEKRHSGPVCLPRSTHRWAGLALRGLAGLPAGINRESAGL